MQAVRDWFDQTRRERREAGTAWLVIVLACVAFQALMVARLLFAGSPRDGIALALVQSTPGAVGITIAVVLTGMILLWSPRWPVLALAVIGAAYLAASAIGMHDYVAFPVLFALFRVVADSGLASVAGLVASTCLGMLASSWLATSTTVVDEYVGQLSVAALSILAGVGVRSVRGWQAAAQQSHHDAERARAIAAERDQAIARTRIAAELHDSVGHNLTAIIALSQGLSGTTENPDLDESLEDIEAMAREGLDETRRAVALLGRLENPAAPAPDHQRPHSWDDIHAVADRVRALNVPVTVTETGRRPNGTPVADLGFSIVREALTNAVRHTEPLERVSIAIDHHLIKGSRVTIRSHGRPRHAHEHEPGSGLQRLSHRVTTQGGTFAAGPGEPDQWIVDAKLPPAPSEENDDA
ncbi:histidine kinase [Corynebacterium freneyi]|uniref:histidine kinase n=1 Tax=Corynebacterium freneyi TaxID=134034 RepID=UPI001CCAB7B7|nr:histidine kinase [Corynebacterium freneyi]UBI02408.1 histidine kinase [Corynebacterium freneyi]